MARMLPQSDEEWARVLTGPAGQNFSAPPPNSMPDAAGPASMTPPVATPCAQTSITNSATPAPKSGAPPAILISGTSSPTHPTHPPASATA